jgi:hypothetical protein
MAGGVTWGVGPEFKPQYSKEKKIKLNYLPHGDLKSYPVYL